MTKSDQIHGAIISSEQEDHCGFTDGAFQMLPYAQAPGNLLSNCYQESFALIQQVASGNA